MPEKQRFFLRWLADPRGNGMQMGPLEVVKRKANGTETVVARCRNYQAAEDMAARRNGQAKPQKMT